jgi:RHS repeat-associated protein
VAPGDGLYYCQSRYYDAVVGRWINADDQVDTKSESMTAMNLYVYSFNNPVNYFDPNGHDAIMLYQQGFGGFGATSGSGAGPAFGDVALLVQNKSGDWYFFLWGVNCTAFFKVNKSSLDSFDALNNALNAKTGQGYYYSDSIYLKGNYQKTFDYCQSQYKAYYKVKIKVPYVGHVNPLYNLFSNNCATKAIQALGKSNWFYRAWSFPKFGSSFGFSYRSTTIPLSVFYANKQITAKDRRGVLKIA